MQIIFDEPAARLWVAQLIDQGEAGENIHPALTAKWVPADPGEETTIFELLHESQQGHNLYVKPEGVGDLTYVYDADSDGGGYLFTVDVAVPGRGDLRLASHWTEMRKIVVPYETRGVDAAISILDEAVRSANEQLATLRAYAASTHVETARADNSTAVITAYNVDEEEFRGLEPLFGLSRGWLGRWKGGEKVILDANNLPGFDVQKLTGYLAAHGITYEVETTTKFTPTKEDNTA